MVVNPDIWILEIEQNTLSQLTTEGENAYPIWTPDGMRVTFASTRTGTRDLYWKSADFSDEEAHLLLSGENLLLPGAWAPDGESLVLREIHPERQRDILVLRVEDDGTAATPSPFLATPFSETAPTLSPDGNWIAYTSNLSERYEVYVEPFPGGGRRVQVSNAGGIAPLWGPDGREIFYRSGDGGQLIAASVETEPMFDVVEQEVLFDASSYLRSLYRRTYDITPDGQRILMIDRGFDAEESRPRINVILNWFEELKQRVNVNGRTGPAPPALSLLCHFEFKQIQGEGVPKYRIPLTRSDLKMLIVPDEVCRGAVLSDKSIKAWVENEWPPILTVSEILEL